MYVTCIGFAQKFLTNGFLPASSLSSLSHVRRPLQSIKQLVKAGLLEQTTGGYQIHDYLEFNDSAEVVKQKREVDRVRKESERSPKGIRPESARNPSGVLARAPASHPIPSLEEERKNNKLVRDAGVSTTSSARTGNGNGGSDTRSRRPIYQSDRFVVFDWMLDDLTRLLGSHTDTFDLHAFFDTLTQQSRSAGLVIPQRDSGAWLQAQVLAEAQRRGLPIATAPPPPTTRGNKRVAGLIAGGQAFLKNHGGSK